MSSVNTTESTETVESGAAQLGNVGMLFRKGRRVAAAALFIVDQRSPYVPRFGTDGRVSRAKLREQAQRCRDDVR